MSTGKRKQSRSANGEHAAPEPTPDETADAAEGASADAPEPEQAAAPDAQASAESAPEPDGLPPLELDSQRLKAVLESLIFVSERTVTAVQLARFVKVRVARVREVMKELIQEYAGRGIELIEVAGGYQLRSAPACAAYVREFVAQKPVRLTRAQLETLALIAYRQPITRPEIDDVRGVDSGSAMRVLLERGLIKMLGRKDEPGRPLLYGTTSHFLEFFGMRSLKDLPTLREFTELSDENRALFKRKTGESVEDAEAALLAAEEAAQRDEEAAEHISDEDLAELAAEADAEAESATLDEPERETERRGAEQRDAETAGPH